jgi:GAF domain-containing protein
VYVFDSKVLRNVALFDRWQPSSEKGANAPVDETFCAIVGRTDALLEVVDGRSDARFPHMRANAVQSYCGAPIRDESGRVVGTLCHFDLMPCQVPTAELPVLTAAAQHLFSYVKQDLPR